MRIRKIAAEMTLVCAGLAAPCWAAERPTVVREHVTIESPRMVLNPARSVQNPAKRVTRLMPVDVTIYRPSDTLKHPAIVYLHGGAMSFADPVMDRFHTELASRGLVVLAPHYLLDGTGWPHWNETAERTVSLATRLPSVDKDHIGMAGLSMGGQIGLSTAARDHRIKAVAEFFTAWPGTLPDEPIAKLPPVLLLNGTADPVIPFPVAMVLDKILEEHKLPFERHVYQGLGHGFSTPASFRDGVARASAFFGGAGDEAGAAKPASSLDEVSPAIEDAEEWIEPELAVGPADPYSFLTGENGKVVFRVTKKKRRLAVKNTQTAPTVATPPSAR